MSWHRLSRDEMARRVAQDIPDGSYVNLGIGLPTLVGNVRPRRPRDHLPLRERHPRGRPGAAAGRGGPRAHQRRARPLVTLLPGGSYFHHTDSFVIMRGGHLDVSVLGAFQVACQGRPGELGDRRRRVPARGRRRDGPGGRREADPGADHAHHLDRRAQADGALHLPADRRARRRPDLHRPRGARRDQGRLPGPRDGRRPHRGRAAGPHRRAAARSRTTCRCCRPPERRPAGDGGARPGQGKTTVRVPLRSTRWSRCQPTARASAMHSRSRPTSTSRSGVAAWSTRATSCSMIGPSSSSAVT